MTQQVNKLLGRTLGRIGRQTQQCDISGRVYARVSVNRLKHAARGRKRSGVHNLETGAEAANNRKVTEAASVDGDTKEFTRQA